MINWQKILKKYLTTPVAGTLSRSGVEFDCAAFFLLRAVLTGDKPIVALFPDLNSSERVAAECVAITTLIDAPTRILELPECGRGKLLFPGGESQRARALNAALTEHFDLYIGSVHSFTAPAPKPTETLDSTLTLRAGIQLSPAELCEKLLHLDYDDEYESTVSGEFARRGGIVDVYSPAHDFPCRVEFFGDEIDSLRAYAPDTQRSTQELTEYRLIGRAGITAGGNGKADFFDYIDAIDYRLVVVHPESSRERLKNYSGEVAVERLNQIERRCAARGDAYAFYDTVESASHPDAIPAEIAPPLVAPDAETKGDFAPESRQTAYALSRRLLEQHLQRVLLAGFEVVLIAPHPENIPALRDYCRRLKLENPKLGFDSARLGHGFALPNEKLVVITEREFVACIRKSDQSELDLEEEPPKTSKEVDVSPISIPEFSLADLDYGDYAVHLDHGIGIFRGFKTLETRGVTREVLVLEYRDGQQLYVPLLQAHKVNRYLGSPGKVHLHALGGSKWSKDKDSARHAVRSYASDMLRLQAMRQSAPGIVFPKDNGECRAFVKAFPFSDTPDQRRSTAEIYSDMESSRPMDRLLCGDVGYGKTEIAMRAVFKAVNAGYQAAILAPTTVLAQQHYNSFQERFAQYPFTIEMLSRFRTAAEQSDILRRLKSGGIDIIIGTHRLCTPELRFANLGIVVIDEEQRFGVKHKDRLRRFRAEVDVLTMSATPIPRTLYLAMAGARDLSTLMTAPKQRLPVKTVIAPEEEGLIVQAIKAELARGGQVYFLHNRVRSIAEKANWLQALIPEARIAVAHGRMHEHELEEVMTRFLQGEVDCLVCSTIIESGLDVPNANTILIERADRFGLAELYQLRGRVGRWKHQAYSYMLLPKNQLVSSDARKRLAAIRRCSNLGAGFQLALRDLEIRGSGNLLGSEQSGHLDTIGFDLYCQLLKHEIALLRGERHELLPEVEIGIDFVSFSLTASAGSLAAAIPPDYIGGDRLRLEAYRKLSALENEAQLAAYQEELRDRFGPLPESVENLLAVTRLRILAAQAKYEILTVIDGKVTLKNPGGTIYRVAGKQPQISYLNPPKLRLKHLLELLRKVVSFQKDLC
ncbi:MAG: transcription-repair coupling factor [Victivallales bacterium]|jgi:transcription-repair coupling factor (superfamily II helicase)|nr:transcription-repair coupling factor [Victivallales bacterium]